MSGSFDARPVAALLHRVRPCGGGHEGGCVAWFAIFLIPALHAAWFACRGPRWYWCAPGMDWTLPVNLGVFACFLFLLGFPAGYVSCLALCRLLPSSVDTLAQVLHTAGMLAFVESFFDNLGRAYVERERLFKPVRGSGVSIRPVNPEDRLGVVSLDIFGKSKTNRSRKPRHKQPKRLKGGLTRRSYQPHPPPRQSGAPILSVGGDGFKVRRGMLRSGGIVESSWVSESAHLKNSQLAVPGPR